MFFSVIIPTYNPRQFLPTLLDSISHNECIDDIEIIISDDVSTESFDDILESYVHLNIKKISNEQHMGFPRNGRQHGAEVATGTWICFSDQDDYFLDGAFDKIKKFIFDNNCKNYIISDFILEDAENHGQKLEDGAKGWTHGKFYEKVFWDKYKIGYDDVRYCEDINLSTKLSCLLTAERITYYKFNEPIYVWLRRKDSLSDIEYFVHSFPDYIRATLGVIMPYLEKYKDDKEIYDSFQILFFQTFLHMYFYLQSPSFFKKKKIVLEIILILQPIYEQFKEITHYTNEMIIQLLSTNLLSVYASMRNTDFNQIPFIEQLTFKQWLEAYFD